MKKLILLYTFVVLGGSVFATHKTLDAAGGQQRTEVLCGETDSITVIMDTSSLYLNVIHISMKGAKTFSTNGYFWQTRSYTFPTNGDLTVDITKWNLLWIIVPYFILCLVLFGLAYFLKNFSTAKEVFISTISCVGLCSLLIPAFVCDEDFAGQGYILSLLIPWFLLAWGIIYLAKKSRKRFYRLQDDSSGSEIKNVGAMINK